MRCTGLCTAAWTVVGVLNIASWSEGFVIAGARSLLLHPRAASSATASAEHHGRATLRMGAAGKKRKKVRQIHGAPLAFWCGRACRTCIVDGVYHPPPPSKFLNTHQHTGSYSTTWFAFPGSRWRYFRLYEVAVIGVLVHRGKLKVKRQLPSLALRAKFDCCSLHTFFV